MDQTDAKTKRQADQAAAVSSDFATTGVIVVEDAKKGKRRAKRGSSKTARRLEDIERRVSKSVRRVTRAVNRGMSTYIDKRDKSARRRRDGALVDFYVNASRGISDAVADASPALVDLSKAFNRRRYRKRIRRVLRRLPRIPLIGYGWQRI
jgi:hypothetical protein